MLYLCLPCKQQLWANMLPSPLNLSEDIWWAGRLKINGVQILLTLHTTGLDWCRNGGPTLALTQKSL